MGPIKSIEYLTSLESQFRETLNHHITAVVNLMSQNNMKESFVTDGFVVTSVDDIDKGTPSAALSFANDKYGLEGTYV